MSLRSVLLVEEHPDRSYGGVALRNAAAAYALSRLGPLTIADAGAAAGDLATAGPGAGAGDLGTAGAGAAFDFAGTAGAGATTDLPTTAGAAAGADFHGTAGPGAAADFHGTAGAGTTTDLPTTAGPGAAAGDLATAGAGAAAHGLATARTDEVRSVGLGRPPSGDPDALLRAGGHPSDARWSAAADDRWNALLDQVRPDVVVIEQLWLHAGIAGARRVGARVVLDAHNVEAEVYAAIAATGPSGRGALDRLMAGRTAALEARVARAVDQVWACSTRDQEVFAGLGSDAVVVPNVVDVARTALRDPAGRRPLLVFPASLAYPPNIRAARTLVEHVLPFWDGELALVGHSPPRWLLEAARLEPRLLVPGRVESLRPFLEQACAVVVPLTEGGGTRFKVLEAMAAGVPVISTSKGVEGLAVRDGEHVLLAERPAELLTAASRLLRHEDQGLVRRARQLVSERYSWQVAAAAVQAALG